MTEIPHPGDRIRLLTMQDDPDPIRPGTLGVVTWVTRHGSGTESWHQIGAEWDNGRTLMLVVPPDLLEIIDRTLPQNS